MLIEKIYAQLYCRDLERSMGWFETLFQRHPDVRPMRGLAEWHESDAGFQLSEEARYAGCGALTLIIKDLRSEQFRLIEAGLAPSEVQFGDFADLVQLRDPDRNFVVLAEPRSAQRIGRDQRSREIPIERSRKVRDGGETTVVASLELTER